MTKQKRTPSRQPQKTGQGQTQKNHSPAPKKSTPSGQLAQAGNQTLRTWTVGSLPLLNRMLERMDLHRLLETYLRPDGARTRLPTASALLVLVRNLLVSREPMYGVGEWAARYAPDLLGLSPEQLAHFNDDRLGRCLDRLFETSMPDLILAVVRQVMHEFDLDLDELHNDSTTVTFSGAYDEAEEEGLRQGRKTLAITYGHNKAGTRRPDVPGAGSRPDLKQLLYVLTVTDDGGVPVFFTAHSGNVVDDQTHRQTWDLLHQLIGHADFLYVADCKLASTENLQYIHRQGGRFITVLPGSRKEDRQFKERLLTEPAGVSWDLLYDLRDDEGQLVDRLRVCSEEFLTKEGYRLWWFHSTRKAHLDDRTRLGRIERAMGKLTELRERLAGPRPRLRTPEQVRPKVEEILQETQAEGLLRVEIQEYEKETFRQTTPGRPGKNTQYVRQVTSSCDLAWQIETQQLTEAQKTDGVFPLLTNRRDMTAEEVLRAYKRQPIIEKRFSQLKTDFQIAPVCLKSVSRIQGLLGLYFFGLMVQTLLEREVRQAMQEAGLEELPLYPEGRACKAPTTRRLIDVFEPIQRHVLSAAGKSQTFTTELSPLQCQILKLLDIPTQDYAR
jgi:transposase